MRRKIKIHHVFISYSIRETEEAEAVRNILEKNRIACWMAPRDISAGANYTREIPAAIRGCQVFLLILSQNAQNSTWVPRELEAAVNCGKVIIPFMVEDFQLNNEFNFLLGAKHRYAAYQNNAEIMQILIERIRAIIGDETTEPGIEKKPKEENTAEEKREQPSEKKPERSLVEISDKTPHCPVCGRELIQKMKPIDGKDI